MTDVLNVHHHRRYPLEGLKWNKSCLIVVPGVILCIVDVCENTCEKIEKQGNIWLSQSIAHLSIFCVHCYVEKMQRHGLKNKIL